MRKLFFSASVALTALIAHGQPAGLQQRSAEWLTPSETQMYSAQQLQQAVKTHGNPSGFYNNGRFVLGQSISSTHFPSSPDQWNGALKSPFRMPLANVQTKASDIITTQPEGTVRYFNRSGGTCIVNQSQQIIHADQFGVMKVVIAPDFKTMYFMDPLSQIPGYRVWFKAEMSADGTSVTMPLKQNHSFYPETPCYGQLDMLNYDNAAATYVADGTSTEVKFDFDGDNLRMVGTDRNHIVGITRSDNGAWMNCGDYETVYSPFTEQTVSAPVGLETKRYRMSAKNNEGKDVSYVFEMGFVGDEVYVEGFCAKYASKGWVKGTRTGNTLNFPSLQFQGVYDDFYPIFMMGCDVDGQNLRMADNLVFTYDEATKTYSSNMFLLENALKNNVGYLTAYHDMSFAEVPPIEYTFDMINKQPEGELRVYSRAGMSWYKYMGYNYQDEQNGFIVNIVYDADGKTVYMKDPITQAAAKTWVKGTRNGNKMTFPLFQCLDYNVQKDYGVITVWLKKVTTTDGNGKEVVTYEPDLDVREATFTVDEQTDVISLDGTQGGDNMYGMMYTNNFQWNGYGDYESVYTPVKEEITTIPATLTKDIWVVRYTEDDSSFGEKSKPGNSFVEVAISGDKMYIAALPDANPEAAIVGTISNGKVKFESDQYLGVLKDRDAIAYFGGATYTIEEIVYDGLGFSDYQHDFTAIPSIELDYNPETKVLVAPDSTAMLVNGGKPTQAVAYIRALCDPKFNLYDAQPAVPVAPKFVKFVDWSQDYGQYELGLDIRNEDVDGRFIEPSNLSYIIYIKKNGQEYPYHFDLTNHDDLDAEMEEIPYTFSSYKSIGMRGSYVYIYESGIDDVGVEVINMTGNEERRTARIWYQEQMSGIDRTEVTDKVVANVAYYNLSGLQLKTPERGVNIKVITYTDGTRRTIKEVK